MIAGLVRALDMLVAVALEETPQRPSVGLEALHWISLAQENAHL